MMLKVKYLTSSIPNLATKTVLNAVGNKIPSVSNLFKKKADYNTKINEKADFDNKLLGFNKRVNSNKTKHVVVEIELNELTVKVEAI